MKSIDQYIRQMPKVELHVHLEGSVQPGTLLKLAARHHISLPAETVEGIRNWYAFRDFDHFVEIYMTISSCLRTAADIELIAREFLVGQAEQNIPYSEVTFTPYNQWVNCGLGFHEQLDAVNRAREWGEKELGIRMGMIIDIPRERAPEAGERVAYGSSIDMVTVSSRSGSVVRSKGTHQRSSEAHSAASGTTVSLPLSMLARQTGPPAYGMPSRSQRQ